MSSLRPESPVIFFLLWVWFYHHLPYSHLTAKYSQINTDPISASYSVTVPTSELGNWSRWGGKNNQILKLWQLADMVKYTDGKKNKINIWKHGSQLFHQRHSSGAEPSIQPLLHSFLPALPLTSYSTFYFHHKLER